MSVGAGGGTTSVTLGSLSLAVTVPPNAFATATTLKITLEAANLASGFAHARGATSAKRSGQGVPSGATPLAAFVLDAGSSVPAVPITVSLAGAAAVGSGQSVMISGENGGVYDDVAAVSAASGAYAVAANPDYPGLTLTNATQYVVYSAPTASIAAPSAVVSVSGPSSAAAGSQATYAAGEATGNGFPFLGHTFTFGVSTSALGTIASSTATSAVLTVGGAGGSGSVTATDAGVSTFTGAETIGVTSARPGANGLSEQYTGTLTETIANNAISASPVDTTSTANVSLAVTAAPDTADTVAPTTAVTFTANESDASNLETLTSTTTSKVLYQQAGSTTNVRLAETLATESSGVTYKTEYGSTNGLTTVLPETAGTFTNSAAATYVETDPGRGVVNGVQQPTTTKTINADGSYSATFLDPNVTTGTPSPDVAVENGDFSGSLQYASLDPPALLSFGAPSSGSITVIISNNGSVLSTFTTSSFIPPGATQPSTEADTIAVGVPLDPSCTNRATYATANATTQAITTVDTIFGTVETRTTTSYDVNAVGTVCVVLADTINAFYDYSGQEGDYVVYFDPQTQPLITTTETETLSLSTTNAATVQAMTRHTQSGVTGAVPLPAAFLAVHVQHRAQQQLRRQLALAQTSRGVLNGVKVK